jgi:hypothetical protein
MIRSWGTGAGAGTVVVVEAGALVTATAVVFGWVVWRLAPQPAASTTDAQTQTRPTLFVGLLINTDKDSGGQDSFPKTAEGGDFFPRQTPPGALDGMVT